MVQLINFIFNTVELVDDFMIVLFESTNFFLEPIHVGGKVFDDIFTTLEILLHALELSNFVSFCGTHLFQGTVDDTILFDIFSDRLFICVRFGFQSLYFVMKSVDLFKKVLNLGFESSIVFGCLLFGIVYLAVDEIIEHIVVASSD